MSEIRPDRRDFFKTASLIAVGAATSGAVACQVKDPAAANPEDSDVRVLGFDRALLDAVASAVLPESLGPDGIKAATDRFVSWSDGYDPVAEEMHGYGYSDVRYLPADPAPAWRAQLSALDQLTRRTQHTRFVQLNVAQRREIIAAALRGERGDRLPSPLGARHVVLALLGHWSSSADGWNRVLGVQVSPLTCRTLGDAVKAPLPVVSTGAGVKA